MKCFLPKIGLSKIWLLPSILLAIFLTSCDSSSDAEITSVELSSDRGSFSYTVAGAVDTFQMGQAEFYRAGTHVVVIFESRTDPLRLELAYEETRSNHIGVFEVVQKQDPGGFALLFKNFEEEYWQESGSLEITYSSPDTVIGRMDEVRMAWQPDPELYPDSLKQIELIGHFEAY